MTPATSTSRWSAAWAPEELLPRQRGHQVRPDLSDLHAELEVEVERPGAGVGRQLAARRAVLAGLAERVAEQRLGQPLPAVQPFDGELLDVADPVAVEDRERRPDHDPVVLDDPQL